MTTEQDVVREAAATIAAVVTKLEAETGRPVKDVSLQSISYSYGIDPSTRVVARTVEIELGAQAGSGWVPATDQGRTG